MIPTLKKFYSILELSQKKFFLYLIILSSLTAFLEMISLGLLVPIIATLNDPNLPSVLLINKYLDNIFINFTYFNDNKLFYFLLLFGSFFLVKTLILTYFAKAVSKFSSDLYSSISGRVFNNYLHQDYIFHISRSSSQLIQNATNEVNNLVNIFFISILLFVNEILVLFAIGLILIFISSLSFFFVTMVFGFFSFIFIFIIKKLLKKFGYVRLEHQTSAIRYIQDGIRNIKDLKIYGIENKFYSYFRNESKKYSDIEQNVNFLSAIPKYFIEFIGILVFLSVFQLLSILNFRSDDVIIIVGILAASSLKILPSVNRILNAVVKIKYSFLSVNIISKELALTKNLNKKHVPKNILIEKEIFLKKISFKYPNRNNIFHKINLRIPIGKVTAIIGDSGSGKTTLIDLILGILKPLEGEAFINKVNFFKNIKSWQDNIGYVQQFSYFIQDSIKTNISLGSKEESIDCDRVNACLKIVGLERIIHNLPRNIESSINELGSNFSGGQKQRLSIARALYKDPKILVLDEATNSLDDKSEEKIIRSIIKSQKNRTIIIVTHKKKFLKYCDVVFEVNNGNIKRKK